MPFVTLKYMTVTVDIQPEGMNIACWISTVDFWTVEKQQFPFPYTYMGDSCTWLIHANIELTNKMVAACTEYADRICLEQQAINARRKVANR